MMHELDQRYARQVSLPEIGEEGQGRLQAGSVLVVGAGGLGCPVLLYLTAAGVGSIGVVDHDRVETSNLQRQVLFHEADLGKKKSVVAVERLSSINSSVRLTAFSESLTSHNASALIGAYDLVLDCTDDIETRYLINDTCRVLGKPMVYGALHRFQGQVSVFQYRQGDRAGTDYRALVPEYPEPALTGNCATDGILGAVAGVIGSLQAEQAIRLLCGYGEVLSGKVLLFDFRHYQLHLLDLPEAAPQTVAESAVRMSPASDFPMEVSADELTIDSYVVLDVREAAERSGFIPPNAVHLPFSAMDEGYNRLDPALTWLVFCENGMRSRAAAGWLRSKGFRHVYSLSGGAAALKSTIQDLSVKP
jgi:adenylyltransferase/sulfurtransferase